MASAPFTGCRVIELGDGSALAYCGKILAGFGADVLKVEPEGGDPGRSEPPLVTVAPGKQESAFFAWLNTAKRSMAAGPTDAGRLRDIITQSDILLDSRPFAATQSGPLAHAALRDVQPGLIVTAISWFGEDGPYRDFAGSDLVCRSLAGLVELIGSKERPVGISDHQSDVLAGLAAFIATAAGWWSGTGRRFSVSVHEASVTLAESHTAYGPNGPRGRRGVNRFFNGYPSGVFRCRTGWLGVGAGTPAQWHAFWDMLGMPGIAADPRLAAADGRTAHADEIEALFTPKLLERSAEEWFAEGLKRHLPFAIVPEIADLPRMELFKSMRAFAPFRIGEASFDAPVLPIGPRPNTGDDAVSPRLGEGGLPPTRAAKGPRAVAAPGSLPLDGLRIVDLTMGWAGPLVTRQMADLGAEVVKVESCQYYDWWRGNDRRPIVYAERRYEKRPNYLVLNRNKLGITIDLTTPAGTALLRRLVQRADAVVENYSRDVLPKLGLQYEELRQDKPDLLMLSMPAFPAGPWERGRAYGSTLEQAAGVPMIAGEADWPPTMSHYAYGDAIGGLNGAAALLAGLLQRRATGVGQHIDISQVQCMLPMVASWSIAHAVTGKTPPRMGNRHPHYVLQDCFPTAGEDRWLMLSVIDPAMWERLCRVIGRGDLADLAAGGGPLGGGGSSVAYAVLTEWLRDRDGDDAMAALQAAQVAAGVVRSPFDLGSDPHLRARGFWQAVERAWVGRHDQPSAPFRENGVPYSVRHAAPTLGEFNSSVLGGLLGLQPAELAALEQAGVIGCEGRPPAATSRHAGRGGA